MVESGFRIPWSGAPAPLSRNPLFASPPACPQVAEVLRQEVLSLLEKRAISEVPPPISPGFYGRIFVVPKTSGGWRPVLDLSALNRFVRQVKFRMETPSSVRDSIRTGDWAASLDLKDAYFHVLIHPRFRKWLRFTWEGKVFQFRVLPFGLSLSPWVFTRITRELASSLRSRGIRIRMYLDDWLVLALSFQLCRAHLRSVLSQAQLLGFHPTSRNRN